MGQETSLSADHILCARCGNVNHARNTACSVCRLPLGLPSPDSQAGLEALGHFELSEQVEPAVQTAIWDFLKAGGYETEVIPNGWRIVIPLPRGRSQSIYAGRMITSSSQPPMLGLISICGPANDRDARSVLRLNAYSALNHYAIKMLRDEEYFVVVSNCFLADLGVINPKEFLENLALKADRLEEQLTRGGDIY